ncbi:unnamed protein product, partial [marine sediment metagenome]
MKVFAESSILIDTSTGRITVKASREKLAEVEKMIPQFPLGIRQIQIKARVLEISQEVTDEFGTYLERLTGVEVPVGPEGEGTTLKYGPETLTEVEAGVGALTFTFYRLVAGEEKFE